MSRSITEAEFRSIQRPRPGTRKAAPKMTEREVTKQCIAYLRARNWLCIRLQSGLVQGKTRGTFMRLGENGLPDWICVKGEPRDVFLLELKRPGGELRPAQVLWHTRERAAGHRIIVADSLDSLIEQYGEMIEPREQFTSARKRARAL